ncbi:MAG: hypothetical protein R3F47_19455 [Gammaproteobacteria bacterium]
MYKWLVMVIALCGLIPQSHAHMPEDTALLMPSPLDQWKTLETEHFRINYQEAQLPFAQRLASVAENVYARLTVDLQWQTKGLIEVVINDSYDGSNGGASVLPYNRFFIFMNAPVDGELLDNAPWIEQVFTHELIHILHLDQAEGLPANLRHIFGRLFLLFPQIYSPSWVSEGIAVYGETNPEKGFGRGQSALYDAMMRAEQQNGFRSFTQMSYQGYWGTDWPSGQVYLYGYYFFEFLEQKHGHDKAMAYLTNWNDNLIPWRMDSRARQTLGISAQQLWQDYLAYLDAKFAPQVAAMGDGAQTALVNEGRINSDPVWLPNGDFYFFRNDGRSKPRIEKISADGSRSTVAKVEQFSAQDVHPSAGVLIARNTICDNTKVFTDLFRLNERGRWQRLTRCGRYPRMAWSSSGEQIAAVHVRDGLSQIAILDGRGELLRMYDALALGESIGQLDWSPDDKQLVASVRREKSGWNLERLDLESGQWQPLTRNDHLEQQPEFSVDGRHVYYLSDQGKVWNVRRLTLATGKVDTITRTPTAVMGYAVQGDQVRTADYTANGIMLHQQPLQSSATTYAALWQERTPVQSIVNTPAYQPEQYQAIRDYSPLDTMAPQSWLAFLYADTEDNTALQLLVDGQDVLGYHYWQLAPTFYLDKDQVGGSAAYIAYHRLAFLWDSTVDVEVESGDGVLEQWDTETRYQAVWMQPFNSFDGTFRFDIGVGTERVEREMENYGVIGEFDDNFAGIALSWADYDYYVHSVSSEDGRWIKLNHEKYNVLGDAFHQGTATTLDWREYVSLWGSHVLALRAVVGEADDDAKPYELGDELDQFESLGGMIGFGKTGYTLRGYTEGSAALRGANLRLLSAEWRFPLWELFDGLMTPPLGLGKSALHVFADHGAAWNDGVDHNYYTGVGVEIRPDLLVGYSSLKLDSTIGFAKGLDDELGETTVYLRVGASF